MIVRYTAYESAGPSECVSLMNVFSDLAEADAETERLNSVRRDERVEYFVKILAVRGRLAADIANPS